MTPLLLNPIRRLVDAHAPQGGGRPRVPSKARPWGTYNHTAPSGSGFQQSFADLHNGLPPVAVEPLGRGICHVVNLSVHVQQHGTKRPANAEEVFAFGATDE